MRISPPTSKKDIKIKYKELAKLLHPDMTSEDGKSKSEAQIKNDSDRFIEITKAYKYLSDLSE
jgi:DnaJ-class molecular chaperone